MSEDVRHCGVLIVDIAGSTKLRSEIGELAAGRQIHHLLDSIIAAARDRGATFIKAYGDDVLAVFEQDQVAATAEIAIKAQRLASEVGLRLYAGFHFGPVQFRLTDGHPDAVGQTINFVARLHKMAEDAPGQIFLLEESLSQLPHALRTQAMPFGNRSLKGLGKFNVWTLGWQSQNAPTATVFAAERETAISSTTLHLRHGDNTLTCLSHDRKKLIGRGNTCDIFVPDPELKVSSTHATIECIDDCWFLQDISRNGTWLREGTAGKETLLPYCQKMTLPASGSLSVGRPFADDPAGVFTLKFEISRV
ncbi:adenylate/guanylate cyclase domain-containing protein [Nevskia ramosa]|uniref:adenylate/guanylate cyclase domain-containing protein n=1 Tax=Nevskia ramosa TaxID=64002 RepID=UPI003D0CE26F